MTPRFTEAELAAIGEAASAVGITPTGFCAEAAIAVARHAAAAYRDPRRETLAALQAELFAVRVALAGHRPGHGGELADAQLVHTMAAVDEVVTRIHRALG